MKLLMPLQDAAAFLLENIEKDNDLSTFESTFNILDINDRFCDIALKGDLQTTLP